MAKYTIDLKPLSYDDTSDEQRMIVWKGRVMRKDDIRYKKDAKESIDERFLRENKEIAIQDIQNRLRRHRVNFTRDEVIWSQTKERIRSESDLDKIFGQIK